ncbi:MAG: hypothetical protein AABZ26_01170 [Chloroflexota bacterium]
MTLLLLERTLQRDIDLALTAVERATLSRTAEGIFIEVPFVDTARLSRALAFVGVRVSTADVDLLPPPELIPATSDALEPLALGAIALDVVRIRRVSLGDATRQVLARRWPWLRAASATSRTRCRALLDGTDAVVAWDRRAWGRRSQLRDRRVRAVLRPIVFDRGALEGDVPRHRAFATSGAITRWAFG